MGGVMWGVVPIIFMSNPTSVEVKISLVDVEDGVMTIQIKPSYI